MIRYLLIAACLLQPFNLQALQQEKDNSDLILDDQELSLLNESLKILMHRRESYFERLSCFSDEIYNQLGNSPSKKWEDYCIAADSLGFLQFIGIFISSVEKYVQSKDSNDVIDSWFRNTLSWFNFDRIELFVFKLVFIQNMQKIIRSNNYIKPWDKLITFVLERIDRDDIRESSIISVKRIVKFKYTEFIYKGVEVAYDNICEIKVEKEEKPGEVIIKEETSITDKFIFHKIKFNSRIEGETFIKHIKNIIKLDKINKKQRSEFSKLLLKMYKTALMYDDDPQIIDSDKSNIKFSRKLKGVAHDAHPSKISPRSNRDICSSSQSLSPSGLGYPERFKQESRLKKEDSNRVTFDMPEKNHEKL